MSINNRLHNTEKPRNLSWIPGPPEFLNLLYATSALPIKKVAAKATIA